MIYLGNTHFTWVMENARLFLVGEDIFRCPIGISFFSAEGIVLELDLNMQLFVKVFRK